MKQKIIFTADILKEWDCPRRGYLAQKDRWAGEHKMRKPLPQAWEGIDDYIHKRIFNFLRPIEDKWSRREVFKPYIISLPEELREEADAIFQNFVNFFQKDMLFQLYPCDSDRFMRGQIGKYYVEGTADLIGGAKGFCLVRDWRTDCDIPPEEKIEDLELPLYAILYDDLFHDKYFTDFALQYIFLRQNYIKSLAMSREGLRKWKEKIIERMDFISKSIDSSAEPAPMPSPDKCSCCDYSASCPTGQRGGK